MSASTQSTWRVLVQAQAAQEQGDAGDRLMCTLDPSSMVAVYEGPLCGLGLDLPFGFVGDSKGFSPFLVDSRLVLVPDNNSLRIWTKWSKGNGQPLCRQLVNAYLYLSVDDHVYTGLAIQPFVDGEMVRQTRVTVPLPRDGLVQWQESTFATLAVLNSGVVVLDSGVKDAICAVPGRLGSD